MSDLIRVKTYGEPPFCEKEILRYAGCKSADKALLQHLQSETDLQMKTLMQKCIDEVRGRLTYKVCYRDLPLLIQGDVYSGELQSTISEKEEGQEKFSDFTKPVCDFQYIQVSSRDLAKNLQACDKVILFAATIGVEIDRLIGKYSRISPAKALMMQAIGAERIESLCDVFCEDMENACIEHDSVLKEGVSRQSQGAHCLRPRFSPGYGDLPLEVQKDIFKILDCPKQIGLSLNDSLLMSPSKSVTAFVGIPNTGISYHVDASKKAVSRQKDRNGDTILADCQGNNQHNRIHYTNSTNCTTCTKTDCAFREV